VVAMVGGKVEHGLIIFSARTNHLAKHWSLQQLAFEPAFVSGSHALATHSYRVERDSTRLVSGLAWLDSWPQTNDNEPSRDTTWKYLGFPWIDALMLATTVPVQQRHLEAFSFTVSQSCSPRLLSALCFLSSGSSPLTPHRPTASLAQGPLRKRTAS
jgi:hypothetical protein